MMSMIGGAAGAGGAPNDFEKAMAMIALVTDPEKTKARLAELQDAYNQAAAKVAEAKAADEKLAAATAAFKIQMEESSAEAKEREDDIKRDHAQLTSRREQVDRDQAALTKGQAALADERKKFDQHREHQTSLLSNSQSAVSKRGTDLDQRQKDVEAAEAKVAQTLAEAEALKATYEGKLRDLRAIAG